MSASPCSSLLERLQLALDGMDPEQGAGAMLARLVRAGLDALPMPGSGQTLQRWQALALVAQYDLSLAKLYEGHTDALAIMTEAGALPPVRPTGALGVWAAESANGRVILERRSDGQVLLNGTKCWCSGANTASDALLTAWDGDARSPQLVHVPLRQAGVKVIEDNWQAVGMAGSSSLDVQLHEATGRLVGGTGFYLTRPGFWQGGAGVAACWLGGARGLALALRQVLAGAGASSGVSFRHCALGKVDLALAATAALMRDGARWIDAHPCEDAALVALRVRLAAEDCARRVLDEVGRALGAAPFCRNGRFARAAADLPVFIRQSHAERDYASLGERLVQQSKEEQWEL